MAFKYLPDFEGIGELMRSDEVTAALSAVTAEMLPKARALAAEANLPEYAAALRVEDGVRPKGRPYSRLIADDAAATAYEYGDGHVPRRRILGEAANTAGKLSGPL